METSFSAPLLLKVKLGSTDGKVDEGIGGKLL
jgi:hypothetical protein